MFQVNITLTMEQVQWEKSKCLAAKQSLQGRGTALGIPIKPQFFILCVRWRSFYSVNPVHLTIDL